MKTILVMENYMYETILHDMVRIFNYHFMMFYSWLIWISYLFLESKTIVLLKFCIVWGGDADKKKLHWLGYLEKNRRANLALGASNLSIKLCWLSSGRD